MLDHVSLAAGEFKRSRAFYDAALATLGVRPLFEAEDDAGAAYVGYGRERPMFWLNTRGTPSQHVHIAFAAGTRAEVDAFHAAALAAGGRDNGAPGLRPQYDLNYYGAFILDPDGHNVEAVCRTPAAG